MLNILKYSEMSTIQLSCDKLIILYLKDFGTTNKTLLLKLIFSTLSSVKINVKFFLNAFLV